LPATPRRCFTPRRIIAQGAPAIHPNRSLRLDAAFHSPAAIACLAACSHNWVNAPGLHLRQPLPNLAMPVRLSTPGLAWFFVPRSARSSRFARCFVRFRSAPSAALPSLPSRTSRSFGILAPGSAQPKKLTRRFARSAFAPRRAAILFRHYCASDRRSGFATFLPASLGFYTSHGTIFATCPLLRPIPKRSVCSLAVTTLQDLSILRDPCTRLGPAEETYPTICPICLRSPPRCNIV